MTPADAPAGGFGSQTVMVPAASPVPGFDDGDGDGAGFAPIEPEFPMRASRAGSAGAIVALGTGLLGAAVVISAVRSRSDGDLDWSNYGAGLGATAVLLLLALFGSLSGRRVGGRAREEVVTWPGVVGILATAQMIEVGIDKDDTWVAYLIGAVMVVLALIGYVAARRAAFVVVAILGLALVYAALLDDFLPDSAGDEHPQVLAAVLVAAFVVGVTVLGWALPSRAVSGVAVGVVGLVGFVAIMASFIVFRYVGTFFGGMPMFMDDEDAGMGEAFESGFGFEEADVWWVLAIAGGLTLLWALAAAIANHSGFSILAIAMPALLVPLATVALAVEHPTRWSGLLAVAGGVLLLGSVVLARLRGRRTASEIAGEPTV